MFFSSESPSSPNFSNFSIQHCPERVLYSANTFAIFGFAISGGINVPNNQPISSHQPIHLASPFPTRTHHPILTRARHPPGPPCPTPTHGPTCPTLPSPARHCVPTRPATLSQPGPTLTRYPPKKIVGSAAAARRACLCVARGRCQGGVQRHGSSMRASCSCVRAGRGRHCCCVAALWWRCVRRSGGRGVVWGEGTALSDMRTA